MRNPYTRSSFKRLKRKSKSLYLGACVLRLPAYLLYLIGAFFSGPLVDRVRSLFRTLCRPLFVPFEFFKIWASTREWKQVIFAAPFLIVALIVLSVVYINKNSRAGTAQKSQHKQALRAMNEGNFQDASMVFGRLIRDEAYRDDPMILYQAMIVAAQNNNGSRFQTLKRRLVEEFDFPLARRWLASQILSSPNSTAAELQEAGGHLEGILSKEVTLDGRDPILEQLASIYAKQGRLDQARDCYLKMNEMQPNASLAFAEVYLALGDKDSAEDVVRGLLADMNTSDSLELDFLATRVRAHVILVKLLSVTTEQAKLLDRAYGILEKGANYQLGNDANARRLAISYYWLAAAYLSLNESTATEKGLECLAKLQLTGIVPRGGGWLLLQTCDSAGGTPVSRELLYSMLVDGRAPEVCHARLGLDAWRLNNNELALFHFKLAGEINPVAYEFLNDVAISLASANQDSIISSVRYTLRNDPPWRTALELLSVIGEAQGGKSSVNLFAQCEILAGKQRWAEITILLEPKLEKSTDEEKLKIYSYLSHANLQLFDYAKAENYSKKLKALRQ